MLRALLLAAVPLAGAATTANVICTNFAGRIQAATVCVYNESRTCTGNKPLKKGVVAALQAADIARFKITTPADGCVRFGTSATAGQFTLSAAISGIPYKFNDTCDADDLMPYSSKDNVLKEICDIGCVDQGWRRPGGDDDDDDDVVDTVSMSVSDCSDKDDEPQDAPSDWNHWYTFAIVVGLVAVLVGMAYASSKAAKLVGFKGRETAAEVEGTSLL